MYPQSGGGGTDIIYIFKLFIYSFTFILITVPLYRRKFCDDHIILVFLNNCDNRISASIEWNLKKNCYEILN